jgi:hypothetical protein
MRLRRNRQALRTIGIDGGISALANGYGTKTKEEVFVFGCRVFSNMISPGTKESSKSFANNLGTIFKQFLASLGLLGIPFF